jgi:uncharacterized lipoprotein YajG
MKKIILATALMIAGCATQNPVIESTLADGSVVRAQLVSE